MCSLFHWKLKEKLQLFFNKTYFFIKNVIKRFVYSSLTLFKEICLHFKSKVLSIVFSTTLIYYKGITIILFFEVWERQNVNRRIQSIKNRMLWIEKSSLLKTFNSAKLSSLRWTLLINSHIYILKHQISKVIFEYNIKIREKCTNIVVMWYNFKMFNQLFVNTTFHRNCTLEMAINFLKS